MEERRNQDAYPPGLERAFLSIPRAPAARLEWFHGAQGTPLGVVSFRVNEPSRRLGTVIYLNGTQSHAGWFEQAAVDLLERGHDVLCLDRRGSGINRHPAGVLSGHVDRYETLVTDITSMIRALVSPARPLYLAAVSWGGKLALAHAMAHPGMVDGLILITPALVVPHAPPIGLRLQVHFYSMFDESRPLPFKAPAAAFSRMPSVRDYIERDPLRLDVLSARFLIENDRLQKEIMRRLPELRLPVQVFLTEGDRIIDSAGVETLMRRTLGNQVTIVRHDDRGHVLALEDPGRFCRDAAAWMRARSSGRDSSSGPGVLAGG